MDKAALQRRFSEQDLAHVITNFRVCYFFSGSDLQPVDDSSNTMSLRRRYKSQLFGGDTLDLSRQDQIAVLSGNGNRIAMKVNSAIFFEDGTDLLYGCFFIHRLCTFGFHLTTRLPASPLPHFW